MTSQKNGWIGLALVLSLGLSACEVEEVMAPPSRGLVHLALGNPSNAQANAAFSSNFLIVRDQYALSYHRDRGTANWVAWQLDKTWLGNVPRQDDFRADVLLPANWFRAAGNSYSGSGFDRGHLCPSADRDQTIADNSATFFMTNIIPQAPDNNQGPWADLEIYCRSLVGTDQNELYLWAGGYGQGGIGSTGFANQVANGQVTVPARTWKVIVVLPKGDQDLERINANTRVIAVDMPNTQGIFDTDWRNFRVSIDAIEMATGLDFLADLPNSLESVLESRIDNQ
ncbi:MAG: DNA/RNA non-specific endonuclease [Microscillaceae bacterium]|nr:DNA/RNA non-specific endonuclease [Microscillaceae bacterium]